MLKWQVSVVILPRSTDGMVQVTSASKGTENINKHIYNFLSLCVCVQPHMCVCVCVCVCVQRDRQRQTDREREENETQNHHICTEYNL